MQNLKSHMIFCFVDNVVSRITVRRAVLLTGATYLALVLVYLFFHNFNIGSIVYIGDKFVSDREVYNNIPVVKNSDGYDGQFYYHLTLDPLCSDPATASRIDIPAYRQQRILFPLAVNLLSFWNRNSIPYIMLGINIGALLLCSFLLASMANARGQSPLWGYVFTLYPGFVFSTFHALPEPFMASWIMLAIYALRKHLVCIACIALSCAVLTRETSVLIPLSIAAISMYRMMRGAPIATTLKDKALFAALIPLGCLVIWRLYLIHLWGYSSFSQGLGNITIPFTAAYLKLIDTIGYIIHGTHVYEVALLSGLLMTGILGVICIKNDKGSMDGFVKLCFIAYAILALCYSNYIWVFQGGYVRALTEYYIFGCLLIFYSREKWMSRTFCIAWGVVFMLSIIPYMYYG